ncbi:MAG TPA: 3-methyl-2-oxobutanoate hydroxymethyltransferase [Sphingomonas sp.]|nr:3-methyl-2-oxobutanoate hydroxymethyltransferase [Sphingomonas sp.]
MRPTIADFVKASRSGERPPVVTCYDRSSALIAERAGLRWILVGDSLGQVMLGHADTIPVTLDDMVAHSAAVARGAPDALIIADLPFLTYATPEQAVASAKRLMQEGGVQAVKIEGGAPVIDAVRRLVDLGVPVMGHLGFTPQSSNQIGVRVQGRSAEAAAQLIRDSDALAHAGAFALVLELVPAELAAAITERGLIPTIGIGAGAGCSSQVQVWHDILGFSVDPPFRHAGRFAEVGLAIEQGLTAYAAAVREGRFPTSANSVSIDPEIVVTALAKADGG